MTELASHFAASFPAFTLVDSLLPRFKTFKKVAALPSKAPTDPSLCTRPFVVIHKCLPTSWHLTITVWPTCCHPYNHLFHLSDPTSLHSRHVSSSLPHHKTRRHRTRHNSGSRPPTCTRQHGRVLTYARPSPISTMPRYRAPIVLVRCPLIHKQQRQNSEGVEKQTLHTGLRYVAAKILKTNGISCALCAIHV